MGKASGWTPTIAFAQGTRAHRLRAGPAEIPPAKAQLADAEFFSQKETLHQMKPCPAQG